MISYRYFQLNYRRTVAAIVSGFHDIHLQAVRKLANVIDNVNRHCYEFFVLKMLLNTFCANQPTTICD